MQPTGSQTQFQSNSTTKPSCKIGLGTWSFGGQWGPQDDSDSRSTLRTAIDQGIRLIDTAPGYGDGRAERLVADVVSELPPAIRDSLCIATKTPPSPGPWPPSPYCRWQDRYSAARIRHDIEQRLRQLRVECLDLLQLHSWTRAWNDDPQPLLVLEKIRQEGKIRRIGICTPEQDQNCVIGLMRDGLVDAVQVVFNLFEQEPAAQLFPVAEETNTDVYVRVALDEGALSDSFSAGREFNHDDFRSQYFAGDRVERTARRVEAIANEIRQFDLDQSYSLADVAIQFAMAPEAVSAVIIGMRNDDHVHRNVRAVTLPPLPTELRTRLQSHAWRRGVWYSGK
ncbi:MAG: aldo/keto reductase [Planctomycetota bacterium]